MGSHFPVLLVGAFAAVTQDGKGFLRPFLNKNIVVKAIVSMQNGHEAHHLGAVRDVIRCVAGTGSAAHTGESAADQIVHHGNALCSHPQGNVRQKDVIVNQRRSVSNLHENILTHHSSL